jgi:RHS repeat-associated protein
VVTDRLGSVGGPARYYPYGGERETTPEGTEKFATYYRDATGLDYAWNRYYTAAWGRFMQADPYLAPEALKNPQGWNRYAYVAGDPVNYYDPAGLFISVPERRPRIIWVVWLAFESWEEAFTREDSGLLPPPAAGGRDATGGSGAENGERLREARFERDLAGARANWVKVSSAIRKAVPSGSTWTWQMLDCIAGLEAAWDPYRDGPAGRTGLFQYNKATWEGEYGNDLPWSIEAARDVQTAVMVKLRGLEKRLEIVRQRRPDLRTPQEQLARAITLSGDEPRFGDAYGAAVLECAKSIDSDFTVAFRAIWNLLNP